MTVPTTLKSLQSALVNYSILVVAEADAQRIIAAGLQRAGFCRLLFANTADSALSIQARETLDLVLLDLPLGGTDGVQLCEILRSASGRLDLPILVMIGIHDAEEQLRILAAGAADVLLKPLPDLKLKSRILIQFERRLLVQDLQNFQHRTAAELATARDMQRALLPDEANIRQIKDRYDIGIAATFKPSAELGGDLWGAWAIDATRMGVFVSDVSGHGTIAAINTFRLHTIMARNDFDRSNPGRFLSSLNDRLTGLLVSGQFVTMLYAVFDTRHDCMTYAAAGSPDPLLALPGCPLRGLDGSGLPLGIVAGVSYPTQRAPFGPGARLVLQSDALAEARLGDGTMVGNQEARVMVSAALMQKTPDAIIGSLTDDIAERAGEQLDDDLTLICIERSAQAGHPADLTEPAQRPAISGRLLVVDHDGQRRQLIQQTAMTLALAADLAPDLTCASRFLAEYRYEIIIVDVTAAPDEWLELFRTIASANQRTRLILIGLHCDLGKSLASSLGLGIAATLNESADGRALHEALSVALAKDEVNPGRIPRRAMTEADLGQALSQGEITFGFQPQVSLSTGRLVGAEALARWTSPEYGAVSSDVFLSLVTNGGAAALLADVTLNASLAACASWRKLVSGMSVAVNFSAASLAESNLASLVSLRLREANLTPDALMVEVAEADAISSTPALTALRAIGVGVALDGFGHGDTSLQSLGKLPVGTVKIGRSIIQRCAVDAREVRLLQAICGAARAFNLTVAAVGVEVHAVEQTLREAGCDIAQGWLYGPAMPASAILRLAGGP